MNLTPEERAKRRLSIGGSDIGTICGVNPHKSAFQLYLQKIGEDEDEDRPETDAQLFGHVFEAPTAEIYALKHNLRLDTISETLVHPDYDFITANPDRVCIDLERLIEIKTTAAGGLEYWRNPESPLTLRVPQHVILQTNHYLGFLGWQEADVVLLNFASSYTFERYYEFQLGFDSELFDLSIQMAINFWENHVKAREAPESQDVEEIGQYLSRKYKMTSEQILESTEELDQIAARLEYAGNQEKHWHQQKMIESNAIKESIGNNVGFRGKDWIYTWKPTASGGVNWKALAESKQPSADDLKRFTKPGYRRQYFRYRGNVE